MKLKLFLLCFLCFVYGNFLYAQGSVITVNPDGSADFTTIQAAIDDVNTSAGDEIVVVASTYTENVTITKSLTLSGANAGTTGTNGARGAESIILPASGMGIVVAADNVTIDGFTINNPGGHYAIYANDHSNITIKNNIISDIGPSDAASKSSNVGIEIICSSIDISNIAIENNNISQVTGGNYTGAIGIAIGWTSGSNTVDGLTIQNNSISNIKSFDGAWNSSYTWPTTRGAYGIEINHSTVSAPSIQNNTIYDLEGLFSHGIGLEANTPNALVKGNVIHDLIDHKSPTDIDAVAIMVEDNPSANTVTIESNSFYNTLLGVRNGTDLLVTASNNWWGDTNPGDNVHNSGNGYINYSPWLNSGNDADVVAEGFQGDISNVDVNPDAINSVVNYLQDGDILEITPGTYNAFTINGPMTLIGNGSTINHGSPAITVNSTGVNIIGFNFSYNSSDYAIDVQAGAYDVTITDCDFLNVDGVAVGNGVVNNGTGTVDARHNYWNSANGPTSTVIQIGDGNLATNNSTGALLLSPWWADLAHTTEGTMHILSSPGNMLTDVSLLPIFTWLNVVSATGYTIEVSTTSTFSNIIATEDIGAGINSYQFSEDHISNAFPLDNSMTYYWRVIVTTNAGDITSETSSFTTAIGMTLGAGNPANGTEVYTYDPLYFLWNISQMQGSVKFRLEIEASANDPFPVAADLDFGIDNISQIYKSVNNLNGGTKYWWRLIGYLDSNSDNLYNPADDKVVVFSSHFNFTTTGGEVAAYPSWPTGANTVYTLTPMFGWYTLMYEPAATYQIIVATSNNINANGMLTTDVEYTSFLQSGMNLTIPSGELTYSKTYYWQVVVDYNGTKNYSAVASFVTYNDVSAQVTKPVISYPTGGTTIYTDAPTLYWYGNTSGSSIVYSVNANTNGSTTYNIDWGDVTGDQYLTVTGLTPGETYTYVVTATLGFTTIVSEPATFTVAGTSSSYPVLSYPTGGIMVYSATPTLNWYISGSTIGWEGYYVRWKKTSEVVWSGPVEIDKIFQTSYTFTSELEEGESYDWAVALYDGSTVPVNADYVEASFSVYGGASNVTINQTVPANGATNVATDVNFIWWVSGTTTGITGYTVEYSPYDNPSLDPAIGTIDAGTNLYASATVSGGTTYKWRVIATLSSGAVASGWYEFTTITNSLAVQPTAGSPSNGVILSDNDTELSWFTKSVPNIGQTYEVEIAETAEFKEVLLKQETSSSPVKVKELDEGEYYWRVRGKNDEGNSYYSNIALFKIGNGVTDVKTPGNIPSSYELSQNYPNPFNPTTTIQYSIPEAGFVSLRIYNLLGQEVKTLLAKEAVAGFHTVQWNGTNNIGQKVTSGIYIYRIEAGNFVDSKKLILLK